jgi:1-acyl-sn-glycerol-3-phosphate acyltransferase
MTRLYDPAARRNRFGFADLYATIVGDMIDATRLAAGPARILAAVLVAVPAFAFAARLRRYDRNVGTVGLAEASRRLLAKYVGAPRPRGARLPSRGPLMVVSNHPGVVDALVLFSALGRDDVRVVANDRVFFKALPHLSRHLIVVSTDPNRRIDTVRRMDRSLRAGYALVLFAAGEIEPDPRYASEDREVLRRWSSVIGVICRIASRTHAQVPVVPVLLSGVFSNRSRIHPLVRARRAGTSREDSATLHVLMRGRMRWHRPTFAVGRPVSAAWLWQREGKIEAVTEQVRAAAAALRPIL